MASERASTLTTLRAVLSTGLMLLAGASSLTLLAGPVRAASGPVMRQTLTGAPAFPDLGDPGEVLSIDSATTSAPGGTDTFTDLKDLVIEETSPNQIAWLTDDGLSSGGYWSAEAPQPFAWLAGSGTVSVVRADDQTTACGSLRADLTVTSSLVTVTFGRANTANRCVVRVSGIKVIPTASSPLVSEAVLQGSGSAAYEIPGPLGVLALTSRVGPSPTIRLSSSPTMTTCCAATVFVAAFATDGADREIRFEQSLDGVTWDAGGTYRTDLSGRTSISLQPRFNGYYRVAFVGGQRLAAGVSNVARVVVRFRVTQSPVHATPVAIRAGTTIAVTTKVSPVVSYFPIPKVEFRLYHRSALGVWTLSTTRVVAADSLGLATWKVKFAGRGDWYVRSRALATTANGSSNLSPIARFWVR